MIPVLIWWCSTRLYRMGLKPLAWALKGLNFTLFHTVLPFQCEIQRDIELMHQGLGIVVHPNVTIGHRVRIYNHVTIGSDACIGSPYRITIEDGVMIGTGAKIIAKREQSIRIGAGAKIGANAVVLGDVPAGATAVGVPARCIPPRERHEN
ncbi:MAG: serine acetyltransferase [Chthonomonadales bacterium]|nr:serine acetyltransferase [Chthonomonadales bacterium]